MKEIMMVQRQYPVNFDEHPEALIGAVLTAQIDDDVTMNGCGDVKGGHQVNEYTIAYAVEVDKEVADEHK